MTTTDLVDGVEVETIPAAPPSDAATTSSTSERAQRTCSVCGEAGHTSRRHSASDAAPARLSKRTEAAAGQWSDTDLTVVTLGVAMLLAVATRSVERRMAVPGLRLQAEEAQAIAAPATRITLRHTRIKKALQGDVADGVALTTAVIAYLVRILDLTWDKPQQRSQYSGTEQARDDTSISNGIVVGPEYFTGGHRPAQPAES